MGGDLHLGAADVGMMSVILLLFLRKKKGNVKKKKEEVKEVKMWG